jgi:ABC-2 type transport system ATP-binding protein
MSALNATHISKSFVTTRAVDTLRLVLDILKPDQGAIDVLGGPLTQATKDRIGYLPEERGLYRNVTVLDCLTYLGSLKGMDPRAAKRRAEELLNRVELAPNKLQKVSELSRGMQQKAQFAATILHDPDLVIIDEPFSGLDPVNTQLIKEMIYEMKAEGKTIIMSTHMMHQVEEMADRLLMMDHGRRVLYGSVDQVREQFALNAVYVDGQGDWAALPGVARVQVDGKETELLLKEGVTPEDVLTQLAVNPTYRLSRFEVAVPSLNDIFITVVDRASIPERSGVDSASIPERSGVDSASIPERSGVDSASIPERRVCHCSSSAYSLLSASLLNNRVRPPARWEPLATWTSQPIRS